MLHVIFLLSRREEPARPEFDVGGEALGHVLIGDFEGTSERRTSTAVAAFVAAPLFRLGLFVLGEEDGCSRASLALLFLLLLEGVFPDFCMNLTGTLGLVCVLIWIVRVFLAVKQTHLNDTTITSSQTILLLFFLVRMGKVL